MYIVQVMTNKGTDGDLMDNVPRVYFILLDGTKKQYIGHEIAGIITDGAPKGPYADLVVATPWEEKKYGPGWHVVNIEPEPLEGTKVAGIDDAG